MYTPDELALLAGPEFNRILAEDPVLTELESRKYNRAMDSHVLLEVMGVGTFRIGALPVLPLTAAKWAFLWMLQSPFVCQGKATAQDLDVLLYILACPDIRTLNIPLSDIPAAASGYSAAPAQPISETVRDAQTLIMSAFHPLTLLPAAGPTSDATPAYDGIWVTRIAGIAARESGHNYMFCLHDLSLSACCAFYANWRAREDGKELRPHNSAETESAIQQRIEELTKQFLTDQDK